MRYEERMRYLAFRPRRQDHDAERASMPIMPPPRPVFEGWQDIDGTWWWRRV